MNLRKLLTVILSIVLLVLEVTILTKINIYWLNIKFGLILIILVSWLSNIRFGLLHSMIIGALYDVLTYRGVCFYLVLFLIVSLVVFYFSEKANVKKAYICLIITLITTILVEFITYFISYYSFRTTMTAYALSGIILPQALVNVVVCFILFFVYRGLCPTKE